MHGTELKVQKNFTYMITDFQKRYQNNLIGKKSPFNKRLCNNCSLFQWLSGKGPACNAGDTGDAGWIPGSGRSPGAGHGNPLQHSCLENLMDRGAWWATVYSIAKSRTQLKKLSMHAHLYGK